MIAKHHIVILAVLLAPASASCQESQLISAISNFGSFGDPNEILPSCCWAGTSGFDYLFEGKYWVGAVVDGERHVTHAGYGDYEWHSLNGWIGDRFVVLGAEQLVDSTWYNDELTGSTHFPLHLAVEQIVNAFWTGQGPDEAFLVQQTLHNQGDYFLDSVYTGWVFDCDVATGDTYMPGIDDWASYQAQRQMGYMWDGDNPNEPGDDTGDYGLSPGYIGIALLDAPLPLCSFQWWDWNEDPANDDEKFQFLAGIPPECSIPFKADPDSVYDYRILISTGPYVLAPGDSLYTAMTFAVGDGLAGLNAAIDEMVGYYSTLQVTPTTPAMPYKFQIWEPFPNPFNPSTKLSFSLPHASWVTLSVFNISGRQVATLVDGRREAGVYGVTFDGSHLTSGIYIYRLEAGEDTASGKMVLIR
jgi:hypothetical protein